MLNDPAIVSAQATPHPLGSAAAPPPLVAAPPPPPPQKKPAPPPIPVSAFALTNTAEEGQAPSLIFDHGKLAVFKTTDGKFVAIPRATLSLVPGLTMGAASEGTSAIGESTTSAAVLIAVHHWVEKHADTSIVPSKFPKPVVYTEMAQMVNDWEKDFNDRLLTHDHETLLQLINFAEAHSSKLSSLLDFAIVSLSCELRGKSVQEMMVALCVQDEAFTEDQLNAEAEKIAWFKAATTAQ